MKPQPTAATPDIKVLIADEIRIRIERGELKPGDSVPTIQDIRNKWRTSTASARAGLDLLRQQGLITGGRGKPLMVRTPVRPALRSSTRHQFEKGQVLKSEVERAQIGTSELENDTRLSDLEFGCAYETVPATEEFAEIFKIDVGADLLLRTYETMDAIHKTHQSWSVSYIPCYLISSNPDLMDSSKEPWPGGTQHQLYTVGIEIAKIVDEVTGVTPTTVDQQQWGLDPGISLLKVRRISIDTQDRVVEVSDALFPADRTKLEFVTPLTPWSDMERNQ
jgi:GntR family transcriptional regulator